MKELNSLTRRNFIKKASSLGALAFVGTLPAFASAKDKETIITILHTNDVHSRIEPFPMDGSKYQGLGGVARRSTLIQKIRQEQKNVLLLDAGDMFQGTPYFNVFDGQLELELMSTLGYDAGTFGNHEFDNGLPGILKHFDKAKFPFITSNYDFTGTVLENKTKEYVLFERDGVKIGVFGLCIDVEGLVDPRNHAGVKYLDPIEVANRLTKLLKETYRCDIVLCLSHLGYTYPDPSKVSDLVVAAKTKDIDLIIGGHTHTFLKEPTAVKNLAGEITLVNQTGFAGINLGRVDIVVSKQKGKKRLVAQSYLIDQQYDKSLLA
ncbi:bifunctional metallophosphatase/5'-nucleotidase [Sphingobacterium hungaricum]|uniref:Metallophosphatase n=1 Tax=Sphingobacterium hungaricum TaxID=2082723 RepID=A0A928YQ72_9SPHI|nr:metallophosphatase [Sphingobacterium hungaricum]MBE8712123.1 metallophosphatase [Sphingobacterium hungaricum]